MIVFAASLLGSQGCDCDGSGVYYYKTSADRLDAPAEKLEFRKSAEGTATSSPKSTPPPQTRPDKIHPRVRRAMQLRPPTERDTLLITFQDTVSRDLVKSFKRVDLADSMVALRRADYEGDSLELVVDFEIVELQRFWLVQALLVTMPMGLVEGLALRPDVVRIEPLRIGRPPTNPCGIAGETTIQYVREDIGSVPFEEAGYNTGKIALLDTGVWGSHLLFAENELLDRRWDCGPSGCVEVGEAQGDEVSDGHGTSTAAILIGSEAMGSENRGLCKAELDAFKVYEPSDAGVLAVPNAAVEAFQGILSAEKPYDVIVVEVAVPTGGAGAVTQAANWAFDLGSLVIVANGNDGGDVIPCPAVAARVLGIGDYCVYSRAYEFQHVHGETPDYRPKPDLTAPTASYTAANGAPASALTGIADPERMHVYSGTSGATPYAAAAGLMLGNWLHRVSEQPVPPGLVYATLLLFTQTDEAQSPEGAGRLQLPDTGGLLWGELSFNTGDSWKIPLDGLAGEYGSRLDAAIWWPEYGEDADGIPLLELRSDLDLSLRDPDDNVYAESISGVTVFERVSMEGLTDDDWSLQVYGYDVPEGPQTVYWAAWIH